MKIVRLSGWLLLKTIYTSRKKVVLLVLTLFLCVVSFGQINNCINAKEHPLILEIIDSVKTTTSYRSILAFTIIKADRIGLARSVVLNLAYAWAACKKIADSKSRMDEEIKYLNAIISEKEFDILASLILEISDKRVKKKSR